MEKLHTGRVRAYAADPCFDNCIIPKDNIEVALLVERHVCVAESVRVLVQNELTTFMLCRGKAVTPTHDHFDINERHAGINLAELLHARGAAGKEHHSDYKRESTETSHGESPRSRLDIMTSVWIS
jgi:hypothetical protein